MSNTEQVPAETNFSLLLFNERRAGFDRGARRPSRGRPFRLALAFLIGFLVQLLNCKGQIGFLIEFNM
jgi:hypothetical protein